MGLNCGIVGLPNVGKSTIFSAITASSAEIANYPFCTIEPNIGIVNVPDKRLKQIAQIIKPEKCIPAIVEFVDIAGLVAGASKGEGLGNQFLGHIRQVGAIAHVVRCFDSNDITHVSGKVDPKSDIGVVNLELIYSDLETLDKRLKNLEKYLKSQDKAVVTRAKLSRPILEKMMKVLEGGAAARSMLLSDEELEVISDLHLLTLKPQVYVCNVDEDSLLTGNKYVEIVKEIAKSENAEVVVICGKIEKEISSLESEEERIEFMNEIGISESGLDKLIFTGYNLLNLKTYFTAGKKEVRAWTFRSGAKAPEAAAIIHTDFQKGFIKAEVFHCDDLFELGTEQKVKEKGRIRIEGKDYLVKDGDVMHFRFNV